MSTEHRRRVADERGSSLIMALVFIVFIAVLATVLLGMTFTGLRSTYSYRTDRILRYNVESALNLVITKLAKDPTLGVFNGGACNQVVDLQEESSAPPATNGASRIEVRCAATAGLSDPQSGVQVDGAQSPRDVTLTVSCNSFRFEVGGANGLLGCGGDPNNPTFVGRARVRFEVDPNITDLTKRAVIPKIITWQTG